MQFNNKKIKDIGEFGLIKQLAYLIKKKDKSVICGINDDAAVLKYTKDKYLLFTTDMLIENVHFTRKMNPEAIGQKALAVNLSDIASMGGLPRYAVISLGLPKDLSLAFVKKIYKGMLEFARKFKVNIVGGDTNQSKNIIINISLLGEVKKRFLTLRSGAKCNDLIFVSGNLGRSYVSGRHLEFVPRIETSRFLVKRFKPSAMIDISDGLVLDLSHILELSGVGAVIYERLIPRSKDASLKEALYDGEDFELIFTMAKNKAKLFLNSLNKNEIKIPISLIGEITSKKMQILLIDRFNKIKFLIPKGFTHF
ncbi:MAG: thiamine-phosphate kinase [Candidatus Omnitrophota bacterium]|nr:thiamine-phosphate kinase [Candidatus Omnitrophota bacterium]